MSDENVLRKPITVGDYETRSGLRAVVLCTDAPGDWPVIGYVRHSSGATCSQWTRDGRHSRPDVDHEDDLLVDRRKGGYVLLSEDARGPIGDILRARLRPAGGSTGE